MVKTIKVVFYGTTVYTYIASSPRTLLKNGT